jgi:hypothetical protein
MRTFVAVVLERITTKCIAFAIFNVNHIFNPSHTLISKSLCDKNRQLCEKPITTLNLSSSSANLFSKYFKAMFSDSKIASGEKNA